MTDEFAPQEIQALFNTINKAIPAAVFCGILGVSPGHCYGYHRSRNWDRAFSCSRPDYSIQLAEDNRGNGNAASALDICWTDPSPHQYDVTRRLLAAKNDPRMAPVREFFGSVDGVHVVGWDFHGNYPVTSDSSHLWHVHLSILRSHSQDYAGLQGVAEVITGRGSGGGGDGGGGSGPPQQHHPFDHTGGWQKWPVPKGVKSVQVTLTGAGSPTGRGGRVSGRLAVKDTQTLYLLVGGHGHRNQGHTGGDGGLGGGSRGGNGVDHPGGDGGGGYSAIRLGGTAGTVLAVAGGAAGASGDYDPDIIAGPDHRHPGQGGFGGDNIGQAGFRGTAGDSDPTLVGAATGGTQNQGGTGGTTLAGQRCWGDDAEDAVLGKAGRGGGVGGFPGPGGGGGGGGYHSGGGGQGGSTGQTPAGGGGGGSNFVGRLTSWLNERGKSAVNDDGHITLRYSIPVAGKQRPNNPHITAPTDGARLKDYSVTIKATLTDPDDNPHDTPPVVAKVRMRIVLSNDGFKTTMGPYYSDWVKSGKTASYTRRSIAPNVHQTARVWAQDESHQLSLNYATVDYYSNHRPEAPDLHLPHNGATVDTLSPTVFTWSHHDPDSQPQGGAEFRFWVDDDNPHYFTHTFNGKSEQWMLDAFVLKANHFYRWDVRTKDPLGLWGPRSAPFRLFCSGVTQAPIPLSPGQNEAVDVSDTVRLRWRFKDPDPHNVQRKADVRWKPASADNRFWVNRQGGTGVPGSDHHWDFGPGTWEPGFLYEWQVRSYDTGSGGFIPSDWSDSLFFHGIERPGRSSGDLFPTGNEFQGVLGCGENRAFLAVKGGERLLGELTPATSITYGRARDDISRCNVVMPVDCDTGAVCDLAAVARTWQNEIVVFRDSEQGMQRVWEGPVTRIAYEEDHVEVEAQDVMVWPYRRIMRQGYNDSYPNLQTVTYRAARLIINALAPDDPNILRFLTVMSFEDDAQESRVRADWQSSAWEEVDDMAANAGLDYTVVGRRIILWDTHRPLGRLPLMRSRDFSSAPVLTEYGMSLATEYGVTNNAGVFAAAHRDDAPYGPVELLVSQFGEAAAASDKTLTKEARQKLRDTLKTQAQRGIAPRYPAPMQVRVPDNSTLRPDTPVPFQYLVPGIWIPLQAEHTCRTFSQWQKLDSVTVTQTPESGEQIAVVMSPAPNNGEDPDQAAAIDAAAGA
jgi:hypothetical protein